MMPSSFSAYLQTSGLPAVSVSAMEEALRNVTALLDQARGDASPESAVWAYRVPQVSPDGSCSLPDLLQPEPYDLRKWSILSGEGWALRLATLQAFVVAVNLQLGADWLGIYRRVPRPGGAQVLLKLAYLGAPSRAEFPLDEAFLAKSTNTRVGLLGRAVCIDDVDTHVVAGGAYYSCDANVRSELCVPVPGAAGDTLPLGIIDAESFHPRHFDAEKSLLLAAVAWVVAAELAG
jgi:L-methionine (R)-S-oxide reductase